MRPISYGYLTMTESRRGPVNICLGPGEKLHPERSRLCKFTVAQGPVRLMESSCISDYLYHTRFPRPFPGPCHPSHALQSPCTLFHAHLPPADIHLSYEPLLCINTVSLCNVYPAEKYLSIRFGKKAANAMSLAVEIDGGRWTFCLPAVYNWYSSNE